MCYIELSFPSRFGCVQVAHKREKLLGHPLVTSFIKQRWKIAGRPVYYLNIFIYVILLTLFIAYVYLRFDCKLPSINIQFSYACFNLLSTYVWLSLYLLITSASIICSIVINMCGLHTPVLLFLYFISPTS